MKHLLCIALICLFTCTAFAGTRGDLRKSGVLYQQQKYGQALSSYNDLLHKQPTNEEASMGAGASAYYLKDYTAAQHTFEKTALLNGIRKLDALFNMGNAYYRAGNKEKAIDAYRQVLTQNPQDKEALHNLQLILEEQQNQQNDNNQNNDQNQDQKSPNQGDGKEQPQKEDSSSGADGQQPQQQQPQQADKDAADRVMQMAKENETKHNPSMGKTNKSEYVEKDW